MTPWFDKLFSKVPSAYTYFTESVKALPNNEKFVEVLQRLGYSNCEFEALSLGIAAICEVEKK